MSSTVKEIKEKTGYLKRSDLYTIGVGQAIGSGVLTLIGPAILLTGQSAWLAYVAACIWGFMMIAPIPWITSTLKLGGGFYSLVGDMAGKRVAGMYAVGFCHRRSIWRLMVWQLVCMQIPCGRRLMRNGLELQP